VRDHPRHFHCPRSGTRHPSQTWLSGPGLTCTRRDIYCTGRCYHTAGGQLAAEAPGCNPVRERGAGDGLVQLARVSGCKGDLRTNSQVGRDFSNGVCRKLITCTFAIRHFADKQAGRLTINMSIGWHNTTFRHCSEIVSVRSGWNNTIG
jgi:hypothetical protein